MKVSATLRRAAISSRPPCGAAASSRHAYWSSASATLAMNATSFCLNVPAATASTACRRHSKQCEHRPPPPAWAECRLLLDV